MVCKNILHTMFSVLCTHFNNLQYFIVIPDSNYLISVKDKIDGSWKYFVIEVLICVLIMENHIFRGEDLGNVKIYIEKKKQKYPFYPNLLRKLRVKIDVSVFGI